MSLFLIHKELHNMNETRTEDAISKIFRPYGSIPTADEYDYNKYIDSMVDNFRGIIRQFRSRMLDLGNLTCTNLQQKQSFRDYVFQTEKEMTKLLEDWCSFYNLDTESVKDAIYAEHTG